MTNFEIGWLAGIIDGEGTVTILKRKRSDKKCVNHGYQVCIRVANTDRRMIDKIALLSKDIGGSFGCTLEKRPNRCKKVYYWHLAAKASKNLLALILPHLITKKEQALLAIEMQNSLSNAKKTGRKKLPDEIVVYREKIFNKIRVLNQRGPIRQKLIESLLLN